MNEKIEWEMCEYESGYKANKGKDKYVDYDEPEPCFGAWNGRFCEGCLSSIVREDA
tara:strand:- start:560 stop:727 length:168 start_codon:yes stop_codon:yes gene_type:complete